MFPSPARIIMLDDDAPGVERLSRVLESTIPQLTIEACRSHFAARRLLGTPSSYHAVICSPDLVIVDGQSLLTRSRWAQRPIPFLLTIRPDERAMASSWLDFGAYDFILSPFEFREATLSVQQALLLSKRREMIAARERGLTDLYNRRARYRATAPNTPLGRRLDAMVRESLYRIQDATGYLKRHITQMERSLDALQRSCQQNELHARKRALQCLRADLAR
jgi:DNA-binding NtrC family response regulator